MEQPPPYNAEPPPQQAPDYPPTNLTNPALQQNYGAVYPPQGQVHPPQRQGYPPQGHWYPPQGHGYPPQGQGYPSQEQGYAQQPAGYSSHMSRNTTVVVQNQPQTVVAGVIPVVNDQMALSIFACLCCCWPIGIFAIMKSSEARNRYVAGDYAGAVASAQSARNLAIAAIICGMIIIPLIIVLRVVVFAATSTSHDYN